MKTHKGIKPTLYQVRIAEVELFLAWGFLPHL